MFEGFYPFAILIAVIASLVTVGLHFEMLSILSKWLMRFSGRKRIFLALLCLLAVHILEIYVFAAVYWLMTFDERFGYITAIESGYDYFYYSSVVYTTVGFGDVVPLGPVRIVTGIESLIGLVLITWSATFMFTHRPVGTEEEDSL